MRLRAKKARSWPGVIVFVFLAALVVGCGSDEQNSESAITAPAAEDKSSVTLSDCRGETIKLAAPGVETAGIPWYAAQGAGVLDRMGMTVETSTVGDTSTVLAAVVSGSADIARVTTFGPIAARAEGANLKIIGGLINRLPLQIVVKKSVLDEAGVSASSALEEKLEVAKGLRYGSAGPGGGSDVVPRLLVAQAGGSDNEINITYLGSGSAMISAFIRGNIDAYAAQIETTFVGVNEGDGVLLFDFAGADDIRGFSPLLYSVLVTSETVIRERPEMLTCLNAALAAGEELVQADPGRAKDAAHKMMPEVGLEEFELAFTTNRPAFSDTPIMDELAVENALAFQSTAQGAEVSVTSDDLITNAFAEAGAKLFDDNREAVLGG